MGLYTNSYLGPFILIPRIEVQAPVTVLSCFNIYCANSKKPISGNFCTICGNPTEQKTSSKPETEGYRHSPLSDKYCNDLYAVNNFNGIGCQDIVIPNGGDWNLIEDGEGETFLELLPETINERLKAFKSDNAAILDEIELIFPNIQVKFGYVLHYS